jgi:hypothetical protein
MIQENTGYAGMVVLMITALVWHELYVHDGPFLHKWLAASAALVAWGSFIIFILATFV